MGLAHGTLGWVDVAVPDTSIGEAFYSGLFGWKAQATEDENMPYTMFTKNGKKVAGMGPLSPEQMAAGQPPMWTPYIIVDDLEATFNKAKELDAVVLLEPMQIFDAGSMFFVMDPVGAAIGFWQSGTHDGAEVFNEPGTVTWNDLGCRDVPAAKAFYMNLLDWTSEEMDMGGGSYTIFKVGDRSNGGTWDISEVMPDQVPAHWLTWFNVDDTDATAQLARDLGGSVMQEPNDSPMGKTAILTDPAGAVFAVIQSAQADGQPPR